MEAPIYSKEGKKVGLVNLPEGVFGLRWNADLVTQVANSLASSKRNPLAHTKTRGEVSGGGKKPWRQKGTGRARHGSTRSPIWVGGGVTHGPRNDKNYERTITKKMKAKALYTILSRKFRDGEVLFVEKVALKESKTKEAKLALVGLASIKGFEGLSTKRKNAAVIALASKDKELERSFHNFSNLEVLETRNLHPLALLEHKYLVIEDPLKALLALPGIKLFKDAE
jgi:large subunit ribosomal protein L4